MATNTNLEQPSCSTYITKNFDTALEALLSPLHQSRTPDAIAKAAERRTKTVSDMRWYWETIVGHKTDTRRQWKQTLQNMKIIHITGTKGKGSTACMCEAILRNHYGCTTALFTSPHLVDIRERIRINGQPIPKSVFGQVYWTIRQRLEDAASLSSATLQQGERETTDGDLPPTYPGYFRMLTLMAIYIFTHCTTTKNGRPVDVIVLEVGMGGRYDATNFVDHILLGQTKTPSTNTKAKETTAMFTMLHSNPKIACGVTLLDYDHTRILGSTLPEIAWEKGGIFAWFDKADCHRVSKHPVRDSKDDNVPDGNKIEELTITKDRPCQYFTLSTNPVEVLAVLRSCAVIEGHGGALNIVDAHGRQLQKLLEEQTPPHRLGLAGRHQYGNATLAISLCQAVMDEESPLPSNRWDNKDGDEGEPDQATFPWSSSTCNALISVSWPGRCQSVTHQFPNSSTTITLRLDGAHTPQSLQATMDWYDYCQSDFITITGTSSVPTSANTKKKQPRNVLVFYCSHERNPVELFEMILQGGNQLHHDDGTRSNNRLFTDVYICPPDFQRPSPITPSTAIELLKEANIPIRNDLLVQSSSSSSPWQATLASIWQHVAVTTTENATSTLKESNTQHHARQQRVIWDVSNAKDVMALLQTQHEEDPISDVLVTGSLYLVGSVLDAIGWTEQSADISMSV